MFPTTSPAHENRYLYHGSSFDFGQANNIDTVCGETRTILVLPSGRVTNVPSHGNIHASTTCPALSTTGTHDPDPYIDPDPATEHIPTSKFCDITGQQIFFPPSIFHSHELIHSSLHAFLFVYGAYPTLTPEKPDTGLNTCHVVPTLLLNRLASATPPVEYIIF